MMDRDYRPKGWLGLLLGSRLWYSLWDADQDDDATFSSRIQPIIREIGDRGKPGTSSAAAKIYEGVPPATFTPAPEPVARATNTAVGTSLPEVTHAGETARVGYSLDELAKFIEMQHRLLNERDAQTRVEKAELEAKLEAKLEARLEAQRRNMEGHVIICDEQLTVLQNRIETLHAAELITVRLTAEISL
eukprot:COSAG02_NODE_648_length_18943_cov_924.526746_12_plen_190_part_00